jgi:hypothetical protein
MTGVVDGSCMFEECILSALSGVSGILTECVLNGTIFIEGTVQSRGTILASNPVIIDFANDTDGVLQMEIASGSCVIKNMGAGSSVFIDMESGSITIDASCIGGSMRISGSPIIVDNSGVVAIIDNTIATNITSRVWNESRDEHMAVGTFGAVDEWAGSGEGVSPELEASINRIKGLTHENAFMDNMVFDQDGQLLSSRVRLFDTKTHCDLATDGGSEVLGLIGEYTQQSVWSEPGKLASYKQVKV